MCVGEGRKLGIEGESTVTSRWPCAFSLLLCFTVISEHSLLLCQMDITMVGTILQGQMYQALCYRLGLLRK